MRRRFLFGIGLLAFFTGGVESAFAADMLARPGAAPPPSGSGSTSASTAAVAKGTRRLIRPL
jgi:hypothetical protein